MDRTKVLILVGPTASGKSGLAIALAKKFDGEIISADSRQVYKGLDIGTGKVTKREMAGVRHHLLDIANPKKTFSAQDFVDQANAAIADIISRGKLPIIAGGTGFYIDALTGRIPLPDVEPDPKLRERLQKKDAEALFAMLEAEDPRRAEMMSTPSEKNNKVRLIRALEIARSKDKTGDGKQDTCAASYDFFWIGIAPDMKTLDKKIMKRLHDRLKAGMVAEARRLHADGLSYRRMEALGLEYRSLARLLQKEISREQFESELYAAIHRYAHKQAGYWRRNAGIRWLPAASVNPASKFVRTWLAEDHR